MSQYKDKNGNVPIKNKMSYQQISDAYNIPVRILNKRVHNLKIKGVFIGQVKYFTKYDVSKILDHHPTHFKYHERKIRIAEYLISGYNGRTIAKILGISVKLCYDCVKEFNSTGCVTVESKLNYGV